MYIDKTLEMVKKLRKGEDVSCPSCKKGIIRPCGDKESTAVFQCDNCKKSLHVD